MARKKEHSLLPWKIGKLKTNVLSKQGGVCTTDLCGGPIDEKEMRANAEFIVLACNAHKSMAAFVECSIDSTRSTLEKHGFKQGDNYDDFVDRLGTEALTKLRGEA